MKDIRNYFKETKDVFGGELLFIDMSKRKAWNALIMAGGIVQPNKYYIRFENICWHNNRLLSKLIGERIKK